MQILWLTGRVEAQTFTNLHNMAFTNGVGPMASLILSGNTLYGTARTYGGGTGGGSGSVFKLNTDGSSFTNLHIFSGAYDGGNLAGSLVLAGNTLFGTALFGGLSNNGVVFGINTDGSGLTNLFSFPLLAFENFPYTNKAGAYPACGLILAGNTLFGTASGGGTGGAGTVFGLNTNGSGFTNLHNFVYSEGQLPEGNLVLSGSTLYGAVPSGGGSGLGALYKVSTNGTGYTNIYDFSSASGYPYTNSDGANPVSSLILSGSTLYGVATSGGSAANGTIFKVNTDGSDFTVLHSFSFTNGIGGLNADGARPRSGVILFSNALYGAASLGGSYGNGTVYRVNTDGTGFVTLYNFTATNAVTGTNTDGAHPLGGLVMAGSILYGTTSAGGSGGYGTVFSILFPPPLFIGLAGTNAVLTWPTNVTGFNLQSATNLNAPVIWSAVGGQYMVTNPITGRMKFFRLMHP